MQIINSIYMYYTHILYIYNIFFLTEEEEKDYKYIFFKDLCHQNARSAVWGGALLVLRVDKKLKTITTTKMTEHSTMQHTHTQTHTHTVLSALGVLRDPHRYEAVFVGPHRTLFIRLHPALLPLPRSDEILPFCAAHPPSTSILSRHVIFMRFRVSGGGGSFFLPWGCTVDSTEGAQRS